MLAKCEYRKYNGNEKVWVGKYLSLSNYPHYHLDCELVTAEKGRALIFAGGRQFVLEEGRSAFINSGIMHFIKAEQGSILAFLMYDYRLTSSITDSCSLADCLLEKEYPVGETYAAIARELREKRGFYETAAGLHVTNLLLEIYRNEKIVPDGGKTKDLPSRYKDLLEEIDRRYAFFGIEDGARFMALSVQYFSKVFHTMSGMTFSKYLNAVKVEKAVELLKSAEKHSVAAIASECGFDTIRNFNRVFRNVTGYSPKELPPDYTSQNLQPVSGDAGFDPTESTSVLIG